MDVFRVIGTTILASGVVAAYLLIDPKTPGDKLLTTAVVSAGAVGAYYLIGPSKPSSSSSSSGGAGAGKRKMGGAASSSHEGVAISKREYRDFKLIKRIDVNHNTRQFRFALQTPDTVLGLPVGQHMSVKYVVICTTCSDVVLGSVHKRGGLIISLLTNRSSEFIGFPFIRLGTRDRALIQTVAGSFPTS